MKHKNTKKNSQEDTKKKKKKRIYIVLPIIFSLIVVAGAAIGGFFAYKSCHKPTEQTYTVKILQPVDTNWSLSVNDCKDTVQVKLGEDLDVAVTAKNEYAKSSINEDEVYYLQVSPTSDPTQQVWTNELSASSSGKSYSASFPMAWDYDITISLIKSRDYEQSFTAKKEDGQVEFVYDKSTLYNPHLDYITKISVVDLSTTNVPKSSFGASDDRNDSICVGNQIKKIYPYFLQECLNYNQPITFATNSTLEEIDDSFLAYCNKFNQELVFPDSLTTIKGDFMLCCGSFNKPLNTNKISDLSQCRSFLTSALEFNSVITIGSSLKQIPSGFLTNCIKFDQDLVIPANIEKIGSYFLSECTSMTKTITINCPVSAYAELKGTTHICSTTQANAACYLQGIKLSGTNKQDWYDSFSKLDGAGGLYRKFILE